MSEQTALTLIALSALTMAACALAAIVLLYFVYRAARDVERRVVELERQVRQGALSSLQELRVTLGTVQRAATLAVRVVRPLVVGAALRRLPRWVRGIGILAGSAAAARQVIQVLNELAERKPDAGKAPDTATSHAGLGDAAREAAAASALDDSEPAADQPGVEPSPGGSPGGSPAASPAVSPAASPAARRTFSQS